MRRKVLSLVLTLTMFAAMSSGTACATSSPNVSETPDWFNSGFSIVVVGGYSFTSQFTYAGSATAKEVSPAAPIDISNKITYVDSLTALPSAFTQRPSDVFAIIISPNAMRLYLTEGGEKAALESMLGMGNVVYFPDTTYREMTSIFEAIALDPFNMTPVDEESSDNVTAYVFKDIKGNYYTGNIIASGTTPQENIDARMIAN